MLIETFLLFVFGTNEKKRMVENNGRVRALILRIAK